MVPYLRKKRVTFQAVRVARIVEVIVQYIEMVRARVEMMEGRRFGSSEGEVKRV